MSEIKPERQLRAVFESRTLPPVWERALVLRAVGIEHEVVEAGPWYVLAVDGAHSIDASEQIRLYDAENRGWPPQLAQMPTVSSGALGMLVYIAVLIIIYLMSNAGAFGYDWYGAGRVDGRLMLHGEWWRSVTALTLHADLGHLAGNVFFGSVFGLFTARLLGEGTGWSLILAGGTLGNVTNVLLQDPSHRAIGASTAVFAALGVLTAYTWMHRRDSRYQRAYRMAPLVSGLVLLAYFGTGDARTDIVAHLTGFSWGLVGGLLAAHWPATSSWGTQRQLLLGAACIGLVFVGWIAAFSL